MPKPQKNNQPKPKPSPQPPPRPVPAIEIANQLTALKANASPEARVAAAASPPTPVTDLSTAAAQLGEACKLLEIRSADLDDRAPAVTSPSTATRTQPTRNRT